MRGPGIVTDLPLFGVAEVKVSDQPQVPPDHAGWGQRWAEVFDAHAVALLTFAQSMGLPDHQAERATGRVLAQHVETLGYVPDSAAESTRKSLLLAMLTEIERVEQMSGRTSWLRAHARRGRAAVPTLGHAPGWSPIDAARDARRSSSLLEPRES